MKLFRYGERGQENPGVLLADGRWIDATGLCQDYDEAFFAGGGLESLQAWIQTHGDSAPAVPVSTRIGPAVARPSKIVCIGLNFSDHAQETHMNVPEEPILFLKATSALAGAYDDLVIPCDAIKVDWEVELAFVIGKTATYTSEATALEHVAGYVLHNDISERAFQLERGGQWTKGKGCDGFAPFGPYLVTPDEIPDVNNLAMWLKVNSHYKQRGTTANMLFRIPFLIAYVSRFMTLLPGDIVSTGTPAGVGLGLKPPQFLRAGDVMEWGIAGLGEARQRIVPHPTQA